MVGKVVSHRRILEKLGRDGMGAVSRAGITSPTAQLQWNFVSRISLLCFTYYPHTAFAGSCAHVDRSAIIGQTI